jgi:hypothetical protein
MTTTLSNFKTETSSRNLLSSTGLMGVSKRLALHVSASTGQHQQAQLTMYFCASATSPW